MKVLLSFFIAYSVCLSGIGQPLQPEIICYASNEVAHTRILPRHAVSRTTQEPTSQFIVTYNGFSPQAQAAFQYAVDQWSYLIKSEVPIRITATWQSLDAGVLGSASANGYRRNFKNAPNPNIEYPMALAEKLARQNLNGAFESDIVANFSSNIDWYYGTDANPPAGTYDLVSVVMHEIGHGLGIAGSFGANAGAQIADHSLITGFPGVYDAFLHIGNQQLIDRTLFDSQSTIYSAVTSSSISFRSSLAQARNVGSFPDIFSPSPFNPGSSISHLDESTFPTGTPHSLMTPFIGQAEAIHDPGEVLMAMLIDMGWEYSWFDHVAVKDTENESDVIRIETGFHTDTEIVPGSLLVHYTVDGLPSGSVALMANEEGTLAADLPNPGVSEVSYYFSATDAYGRTITSTDSYDFRIGPDTEKPTISHTPITEFRLFGKTELPTFDITWDDNVAVAQAELLYRVNGGQTSSLDLLQSAPQIPVELTSLSFGDIVSYQIVVTDASSNQNVATLPAEGFVDMLIIDVIQESYTTDFETDGGRTFNGSSFSVRAETNFDGLAYHSEHPYANAPTSAGINKTLTFLGDIIMAENPVIIEYQDIALIEPGVTGSVFGNSAFRDFIALEASSDGGNTWTPLLGYDARFDPSWLAVYNGEILDGLSTGQGDEALFRNHQVVLSDYFPTGTILKLRFRLFANATANGWGWAMDHFSIRYLETVSAPLSQRERFFYPNPVNDRLHIYNPEQFQLAEILDSRGKTVLTLVKPTEIELSHLPTGIYFLKLTSTEKSFTQKIIKE